MMTGKPNSSKARTRGVIKPRRRPRPLAVCGCYRSLRRLPMALTDFNDLHKAQGIEAVRRQVMAAVEAGPANTEQPPESPPAPSESGGAGEGDPLEYALKRYALIHGETKVFDQYAKKVYKQAGMKATLGAKVFNAWLGHERRKTTTWVEVNGIEQHKDSNDPLVKMLDRFIYI